MEKKKLSQEQLLSQEPGPDGSLLLWLVEPELRLNAWQSLCPSLGLPSKKLKLILTPIAIQPVSAKKAAASIRWVPSLETAGMVLDDQKLSGSVVLVELASPWLNVIPPEQLDRFLIQAWKCAVERWAYRCFLAIAPEDFGRFLHHRAVTGIDLWDGIVVSSVHGTRSFCRDNGLIELCEDVADEDAWGSVPRCQYCGAEISQEEVEYFSELSGQADMECCPKCFARHHGQNCPNPEDREDIAPLVKKYLRPGDDNNMRSALEIAIVHRKASISYLQRMLKIGFNQAAFLMNQLEERGIVGPASETGNGRIILIEKPQDWTE